MKKLTNENSDIFGPFNSVETFDDRYVCDGCELQKTVVGECVVDDWAGPLPTPPAPQQIVPSVITMRQARLALLSQGLLTSVETALDSLPEPQRTAAKITWEYSGEVQRHNGFVLSLAPALGLSESETDTLFIYGATL
jgi:hypothetical protein